MVPTNTQKKRLAKKLQADVDKFMAKGGEIAEYGAGQSRLNVAILLTSYNNNYAQDPSKKRIAWSLKKKARDQLQREVFNKRGERK